MKTEQFELKSDYIELIKLLKFMGLCETGGQAKIAVENELVKVDNEIETRKRRKLRVGSIVTYNDTKIEVIGND